MIPADTTPAPVTVSIPAQPVAPARLVKPPRAWQAFLDKRADVDGKLADANQRLEKLNSAIRGLEGTVPDPAQKRALEILGRPLPSYVPANKLADLRTERADLVAEIEALQVAAAQLDADMPDQVRAANQAVDRSTAPERAARQRAYLDALRAVVAAHANLQALRDAVFGLSTKGGRIEPAGWWPNDHVLDAIEREVHDAQVNNVKEASDA